MYTLLERQSFPEPVRRAGTGLAAEKGRASVGLSTDEGMRMRASATGPLELRWARGGGPAAPGPGQEAVP